MEPDAPKQSTSGAIASTSRAYCVEMGAIYPKPARRSINQRPRRAVPPRAPETPEFMTDDMTAVLNAYDHVLNHWHAEEYPSKTRLHESVASILDIDVSTVFAVMKEYDMHTKLTFPVITRRSDMVLEYMDNYEKSAIRKGVLSLFLEGTVPTLEKAMEVINQEDAFPYLEEKTFLKLLKQLNFKYVKQIDAVFEREEIKQWRKDYLSKINQYRKENRPIYYMDRRVIKSDHGAQRALKWIDEAGLALCVGRVKHLIIMHMGNENGFVDRAIDAFESKVMRLAHEGINAARFEHWFEYFSHQLAENAVVVLENAPYNCNSKDGLPVKEWNNATIQEWLRIKNVPFDERDSREHLMKNVDKIMATYQTYDFDELAKSLNVEVLRMPPYHSHLNAFSRIWPDVENYVANRNSIFKLPEVDYLTRMALEEVSIEKWRNHVDHVINIEEEFYRNIDALIDSRIPKLTTHNIDSDSSEVSSYDENTDTDDG